MASKASEPVEPALPLTPAVIHILLALGTGPKHGYAIMRGVAEASDSKVRLGPGTLYTAIQRMVDLGWITETAERGQASLRGGSAQRRRYYRLTDLGRRVTSAEVARLEGIVRLARGRRFGQVRTA